MAIPRRVRFEVLRRDGHRCRYCGAGPDDAKLTVDHVIPEALGGQPVPANLVTACDPCNSGKASVPPDAPTVAAVSERALRWREAIQLAAKEFAARRRELDMIGYAVMIAWVSYDCSLHPPGPDGTPSHAPPEDYQESVSAWITAGLTERDLVDLVHVAWGRRNVTCDNLWRYYAGCCWRRVTALQERALELVGEG